MEVLAHTTDAVTEGASDVDGPHSEVVRVERPFAGAKLRAYDREGQRGCRGGEGQCFLKRSAGWIPLFTFSVRQLWTSYCVLSHSPAVALNTFTCMGGRK